MIDINERHKERFEYVKVCKNKETLSELELKDAKRRLTYISYTTINTQPSMICK